MAIRAIFEYVWFLPSYTRLKTCLPCQCLVYFLSTTSAICSHFILYTIISPFLQKLAWSIEPALSTEADRSALHNIVFSAALSWNSQVIWSHWRDQELIMLLHNMSHLVIQDYFAHTHKKWCHFLHVKLFHNLNGNYHHDIIMSSCFLLCSSLSDNSALGLCLSVFTPRFNVIPRSDSEMLNKQAY